MLRQRDIFKREIERCEGFSLVELIIAMVITLVILGVAVTTFSSALGSRDREMSTSDAIASAQAALNVMSREIGNTGYGLSTNGIVLADSGANKLHFRGNTNNSNLLTNTEDEDVTYFCDSCQQCTQSGAAGSILRYDSNTGVTSGLINRVSRVDFTYYNYSGTSAPTTTTVPQTNTARVNIKLTVCLPPARNQPANRTVVVSADVTLRNSIFMRSQY